MTSPKRHGERKHEGPTRHRAPLCPKCNDRGWVFVAHRTKGKIASYGKARCKKCKAGKTWDGKSL